MKILNIVGARPNFMKIAPIVDVMKHQSDLQSILVHTGQHYDAKMSKVFFDDLEIPRPDINLEVGSGSHAEQTAGIMLAFEKLCLKENPDVVLLVGDVNSTLACSVVASKLCIPVAHVEAGLRSGDRSMPEEINRLVTDSLSDYLFTTCREADANLKKEGIPEERIFFVGNVMIDTLLKHVKKAGQSNIHKRLNLIKNGRPIPYAAMTLHRPSNVDDKKILGGILDTVEEIQNRLPIVFPIHPRTYKQIQAFGFESRVKCMNGLILTEPLGYLDFLALVSRSKMTLTDSGGLQEETTVLDVPCITIRENTERPITIREGTNTLVGTDKEKILAAVDEIILTGGKAGIVPELWDGKAAERIVEQLMMDKIEKLKTSKSATADIHYEKQRVATDLPVQNL